MTEPIWSPCKRVCVVDPNAAMCVGCFRTMDELGRWMNLTQAERLAIKPELKAREATYRERRGLKAP